VGNETKLKSCPFCGGSDTFIDQHTYWTGMSMQVISVGVKHICARQDGQAQGNISLRRKTEDEAIAAWNTRV